MEPLQKKSRDTIAEESTQINASLQDKKNSTRIGLGIVSADAIDRNSKRYRKNAKNPLSGSITQQEYAVEKELKLMLDRKSRLNRGPLLDLILQPNYYAYLAELVEILEDNVVARRLRYRFKSYRNAFIGQKAVDFMVARNIAETRIDAVRLGNLLLSEGLICHVANNHLFKDDYLFYNVLKARPGASTPSTDNGTVTSSDYSETSRRRVEIEAFQMSLETTLRGDSLLQRRQAKNSGVLDDGIDARGSPRIRKSKSFDDADDQHHRPRQWRDASGAHHHAASFSALNSSFNVQRSSIANLRNESIGLRRQYQSLHRAKMTQARFTACVFMALVLHLGLTTGRWLAAVILAVSAIVIVFGDDASSSLRKGGECASFGQEYLLAILSFLQGSSPPPALTDTKTGTSNDSLLAADISPRSLVVPPSTPVALTSASSLSPTTTSSSSSASRLQAPSAQSRRRSDVREGELIHGGQLSLEEQIWPLAFAAASLSTKGFTRNIRTLVFDYWFGPLPPFSSYESFNLEEKSYSDKIDEFRARAAAAVNEMEKRGRDEEKAGAPYTWASHMLKSTIEITRFLVARDWNVDKSISLLKKALQLRNKYKLDIVLNTPVKRFAQYKEVVPTYHQGFSDSAQLLVIRRVGHINIDALEGWTLDEVRAIEQRMNEIAARVLIPAISRIMRTHEWRSFAIVDMANARIYNLLKKKIRGIFSANSEVAQTCYPENLGKCVVANAPSLFSLVWRFVRTLISARTQRKVVVDSSKNPAEKLADEFKTTNALPAHLGGTRQNPGPSYLNSEIEKLVTAYLSGQKPISELLPSNDEYIFIC